MIHITCKCVQRQEGDHNGKHTKSWGVVVGENGIEERERYKQKKTKEAFFQVFYFIFLFFDDGGGIEWKFKMKGEKKQRQIAF